MGFLITAVAREVGYCECVCVCVCVVCLLGAWLRWRLMLVSCAPPGQAVWTKCWNVWTTAEPTSTPAIRYV